MTSRRESTNSRGTPSTDRQRISALMAILFDCPFCTSTIQVPDSAAGRQGKCPRCQKKLLVPSLPETARETSAAEPAPSAPAAASSAPTEAGEVDPLAGLPAAGEPDDPLAFLAEASAAEKPAATDNPLEALAGAATKRTSVSRALKKRRSRRRSGGLLVPLAFASVLAAVGGFYFYTSQPKLEGTLTGAMRLDAVDPPTGVVRAELIDIKPAVRREVLSDLEDHPLRMKSTENLMEVELRGGDAGLEVAVWETPKTRFFSVNFRRNPLLNAWVNDHVTQYNTARANEMAAAATRFCIDWATSLTEGTPPPELLPYRNRLGLNALRGGAGWLLVAVVNGTSYPCVYEEVAAGELWFLLPEDTRSFRLTGRELDDGTRPFPGNYTVKVKPPATDAAGTAAANGNSGSQDNSSGDAGDEGDGEPGMMAPGMGQPGMGKPGMAPGSMEGSMEPKKMMQAPN